MDKGAQCSVLSLRFVLLNCVLPFDKQFKLKFIPVLVFGLTQQW